MKNIKRCIAIVLTLCMVIGSNITTLATDIEEVKTNKNYTIEDIKALEPYVSVENGKFVLNTETATLDRVEKELLDIQQNTFDILNAQATEGIITINNDLSINNNISTPQPRLSHADNCGGGKTTDTENHWWGYSRYLCDCRTNDFSADLNSAASIATGAAIIATFIAPVGSLIGIDAAYYWLVASRLDANNDGSGVYIEMTYAVVFDITPQ